MNENPFEKKSTPPPAPEKVPVKTRKLAEGVSTGWEQERCFTIEEVIAALKEFVEDGGEVIVTERLLSHEGVLIAAYLRAPGSDHGYSYMLKGNHGPRNGSLVTMIDRLEYDGPNSEDIVGGDVLAEYKAGVWVKK